jgi:hypothetical protein
MITRQKKKPLSLQSLEYRVKPVSFYNMQRVAFEKRREESLLVSRAGKYTVFDEMIALNKRWFWKNVWRKDGKSWWYYYTITSTDEATGNAREFQIYPMRHHTYIIGTINYTNLNYFIVLRRKTIQIYIYRGRTAHMLDFWDKFTKGKGDIFHYKLQKSLSALMDSATPV